MRYAPPPPYPPGVGSGWTTFIINSTAPYCLVSRLEDNIARSSAVGPPTTRSGDNGGGRSSGGDAGRAYSWCQQASQPLQAQLIFASMASGVIKAQQFSALERDWGCTSPNPDFAVHLNRRWAYGLLVENKLWLGFQHVPPSKDLYAHAYDILPRLRFQEYHAQQWCPLWHLVDGDILQQRTGDPLWAHHYGHKKGPFTDKASLLRGNGQERDSQTGVCNPASVSRQLS